MEEEDDDDVPDMEGLMEELEWLAGEDGLDYLLTFYPVHIRKCTFREEMSDE